MVNQNQEKIKNLLLEINDVLKCFPIKMDPGPGTVPPQKLEEGELMI